MPPQETITTILHNFFVKPVLEYQGYNPVNTLFYGALFLVSVWVFSRFFERLGTRVDQEFVVSWTFWVLAAGAIRAAGDQGIYSREIVATPGIGAIMLVLGLSGIGIALLLEKTLGFRFPLAWGALGAMLFIYHAVLLEYSNPRGLLLVASLFLSTATIVSSIAGVLGWQPREYVLVALAHAWDGVNTLVAVEFFGAWEQHFLSRTIIQASPWLFVPVKMLIALLACWCIDEYLEREHDKKFWMLAIATLGLATGTRDMFQILSWHS